MEDDSGKRFCLQKSAQNLAGLDFFALLVYTM